MMVAAGAFVDTGSTAELGSNEQECRSQQAAHFQVVDEAGEILIDPRQKRIPIDREECAVAVNIEHGDGRERNEGFSGFDSGNGLGDVVSGGRSGGQPEGGGALVVGFAGGHGTNQREAVHEAGQAGEVFADPNTGNIRGNFAKFAADIAGSERLHIKGVDVGKAPGDGIDQTLPGGGGE